MRLSLTQRQRRNLHRHRAVSRWPVLAVFCFHVGRRSQASAMPRRARPWLQPERGSRALISRLIVRHQFRPKWTAGRRGRSGPDRRTIVRPSLRAEPGSHRARDAGPRCSRVGPWRRSGSGDGWRSRPSRASAHRGRCRWPDPIPQRWGEEGRVASSTGHDLVGVALSRLSGWDAARAARRGAALLRAEATPPRARRGRRLLSAGRAGLLRTVAISRVGRACRARRPRGGPTTESRLSSPALAGPPGATRGARRRGRVATQGECWWPTDLLRTNPT